MEKLVFVGAGSMAEALIAGIIENHLLDPQKIWVTNRANEERLKALHQQYGITADYDLTALFTGAEAVILAIKPKDAAAAIKRIRDYLPKQALVVSVLAGISIDTIQKLSGQSLAIARAMPNTSAAVGKSATAIAINERVSPEQVKQVQKLFETVGLATFVAEEQLDAVTGLSGSGPAYIYYLIEAMENSAVEIGLKRETAQELIVQTLIGAAEMVKTSTKPVTKLRQEVTSPNGTTEAGIRILEENKVQDAFIACIKAAAARSQEMGVELRTRLYSSKQPI